MQVQVIRNAGPSAFPKIHAKIIPFGMIAISQSPLKAPGQLHHFDKRSGLHIFEAGNVGIRDHHGMAGGVRKEVEKNEIRAASIEKQALPVARGVGRALFAENAATGLDRLADIAKPPRTPKVVHNRDAW